MTRDMELAFDEYKRLVMDPKTEPGISPEEFERALEKLAREMRDGAQP